MKNQNVLIVLIVLVVGFVAGNFSTPDNIHQETSHGHNLPHDHSHEHKLIESSNNLPIPSVELNVSEDPTTGWNIQLITENITFTPENASKEHVDGEGHAHLHINGDKITRIYSEWFHIPSDWLDLGTHELMVTLSSNDHRDYSIDGEVIFAKTTITKTQKETNMNH